MSEIDQNESNLENKNAAFQDSSATNTNLPVISGFTKIFALLILIVGLSTAAVAYAAPQLLEPIANSLPASLFPENDGLGATQSSANC